MIGVLLVAVFSFITILITQFFIKYIKLRNAFRGFPEPTYDKHWLLGHIPHVRIGAVLPVSIVIIMFLSCYPYQGEIKD
jgi:hypothetical protein